VNKSAGSAAVRDEIVSFPDEDLILVNDQDEEIGHLDKLHCHQGSGVLHRAFSLFVFNQHGELLLQQRSADKPLWPLYWSNTCCSHPRRGESVDFAVNRRLQQELGLTTEAEFLYKFKYQAQYDDNGAEHELCWVYLGRCTADPVPNANEVEAWRYVSLDRLNAELQQQPELFTPWFKLEWQELSNTHAARLNQYTRKLRSIQNRSI